jgi:glycosyltransferase involved in cell wall biosynthesis
MFKTKILIDCSELNTNNNGGVLSYSIDICRAFLLNPKVESTLLIKGEDYDFFQKEQIILPPHKVIEIKKPNHLFRLFLVILIIFKAKRVYLEIKSFRVKKFLKEDTFDCLYTPTTYLNYNFSNIKSVVTLHDIQEKDLPKNFSLFERFYRDFRTQITLQNSSLIHVSSKFIKNTISNHYSSLFKKSKFLVIPEGVDLASFTNSTGKKQKQIIFPARPWKHKNHKIFFEALDYLKTDTSVKYILTGVAREGLDQYPLDNYSNVEFKGTVTKEELMKLYSQSFAVLSCSLYESSSLPVLEGIASGCLVLASNIQAHIEMAQDFDISFFDTASAIDLANSILNLVKDYDLGQPISSRNLINIKNRDWGNICNRLIEEIESIR